MLVGIFPSLSPSCTILECRHALLSLLPSSPPPSPSTSSEWLNYKLAPKTATSRRTRERRGCFIVVVSKGAIKILVDEEEKKAGSECWRQLMKLTSSELGGVAGLPNEEDDDEDAETAASEDQGFEEIESFRMVKFSDILSNVSLLDSGAVGGDETQSLPADSGYVEITLTSGNVIKGVYLYPQEVEGWRERINKSVEARRAREREEKGRKVKIIKMSRATEDSDGQQPLDSGYATIPNPQSHLNFPASGGVSLTNAIARDGVDFITLVSSLVRDARVYRNEWREGCVGNSGLFKRLCLLEQYPSDNVLSHNPYSIMQPEVGGSESSKISVYRRHAEKVMLDLIRFAKALCKEIGVEKLGIGPVKSEERAFMKAKDKYKGEIRMVKDFCRCLIVCADFNQLLAALLLVSSRCRQVLVRLKTISLTRDSCALPGGYRHAVVNVVLDGHVCEVLLTTEAMYDVCGTRGVRHYFHSMELGTDTLPKIGLLLKGSTAEERSNMIADIERRFPMLSNKSLEEAELTEYQKNVLNCLCSLLIRNGFYKWANLSIKMLLIARSAEYPNHHPIIIEIKESLASTYDALGMVEECDIILEDVATSKQEAKLEVKVYDLVSLVTVDNFLGMCENAMDRIQVYRDSGKSPKEDSDYTFLRDQGMSYHNNVLVKLYPFLPSEKIMKKSFFGRFMLATSESKEEGSRGLTPTETWGGELEW